MNVLYIGSFPPDFLIKRSGGRVDSLYRDYQAIINGLRLQEGTNLEVITSPDIASWPRGPLFVKHENSCSERLTMVSSLNITLLKQFWTIVSMAREAGKIIRKSDEKVVVVIPYIVFRHVVTLRLLHALFPKKVVQAVIVPDIFFPTKWHWKIINRFTEKMASNFDAFVLYTQKMAQHLGVRKGYYEVIEGFREVPERTPSPCKEFKIVYAGSLNIRYGVARLIQAMSLIDDKEVKLHLYGAGTAESLIEEACQKDDRIEFHGKVPNAEAVDAIYSASVLINPRNATDGDFTEYSFPSKDIEYMATGLPSLLCKLPGMPCEYYGHFIDIGEGSPAEIADAILKVKSMTQEERDAFGEKSRQFIIERMDCKQQGFRIVTLFNNVINKKIC